MPWDKSATDPITWAAKMKDAPREAINAFAFKLFEGVVLKTPVKTGACRQNWLVTLNSETNASDPTKASKGNEVLINGGKGIEAAKGDDTIFIQNNLPYAPALEYGHSKIQAPNGMVGVTLAKADILFEQALKTVTKG
jgi:hypothetical protein